MRMRGNVSGAENLLREVHEQRRDALGPAHPETLRVQASLAGAVADRGYLDAAVEIKREVSELSEEAFGKNHPSVERNRTDFAVTLRQRELAIGAKRIRATGLLALAAATQSAPVLSHSKPELLPSRSSIYAMPTPPPAMLAAFKQFDRDGDGKVDASEFEAMLQNATADSMAGAALRQADRDAAGPAGARRSRTQRNL